MVKTGCLIGRILVLSEWSANAYAKITWPGGGKRREGRTEEESETEGMRIKRA